MADSKRQSLDLAEVYRIIYEGPDTYLRGLIMYCDVECGYQFLYKDDNKMDTSNIDDVVMKYMDIEDFKKEYEVVDTSKPLIKSGTHILLNGPTEASIGVGSGFTLSFRLFGEIHRAMNVPSPRGVPEVVSVPLRRVIESDDGNKVLSIHYAIFENAVEAHLKIKLSHVRSYFHLHGAISARTSAIEDPIFSSVIFYKEPSEKVLVKDGISLSLARPIVGVPLGSKLILLFSLASDDSGNVFQHRHLIDVDEDLTKNDYNKSISCPNYEIEVEIEWKFERKPMPRLPAHEDDEDR